MKLLKFIILGFLLIPFLGNAQKRKKKNNHPAFQIVDSLVHGPKWRNIGPFRGGRSVASSGVLMIPKPIIWDLQEVVFGKHKMQV